ncbi:unnamed protein product [Didymodactylos carnosus]|uniref:Guanylate cyclase n=1 Tax=Didymodactylos carnosus TaxID=1234261 RepID=A0A813PXR3_9BILA|nr:unnamed protein product [Didymodactylos carnosus]CAF0759478.1 unnamed protein product [Didymodactylos carnosus]CAF3533873.1 unnamed protein product [Didymodactylos carnosus]CAF3540161.1 unnamed protein product [Didymodactylos carnosus]
MFPSDDAEQQQQHQNISSIPSINIIPKDYLVKNNFVNVTSLLSTERNFRYLDKKSQHFPLTYSHRLTDEHFRHKKSLVFSNKKPNVTILMMFPDIDHFIPNLKSLLIVYEYIVQRYNISEWLNVKIHALDSNCSISLAPHNLVQIMLKTIPDVVFGPFCDLAVAPVARLLHYRNIPLVTMGAVSNEFTIHRNSMYSSIFRFGYRTDELGFLILKLLQYYKWTFIKFLYEDNPKPWHECQVLLRPISHAFTTNQIRSDNRKITSRDSEDNYTSIFVDFISNNASVSLWCVSPKTFRSAILTAQKFGFINGEYVFIYLDTVLTQENTDEKSLAVRQPWFDPNEKNNQININARRAFESVLFLRQRLYTSDKFRQFAQDVYEYAKENNKSKYLIHETIGTDETNFYDAVVTYFEALKSHYSSSNLTENTIKDYQPFNAIDFKARICSRTIRGVGKNITMNALCDRVDIGYAVYDMDPDTGEFESVVAYPAEPYSTLNKDLQWLNESRTIYFIDKNTTSIPHTPRCGYNNVKCPKKTFMPIWGWVIVSLSSIIVLLLLVGIFLYRRAKFEAELKAMPWLLKWEELSSRIVLNGVTPSFNKLSSSQKRTSISSHRSSDCSDGGGGHSRQLFTKTAVYKSSIVALKRFHKIKLEITRNLQLEVKAMQDIQHDHIARFVGICLDPKHQYIVTEYCPKGSLQDILENEEIKLDSMFKHSIMHDIVKGMQHLHNSNIQSHGNLKSSNCVVDSRFICKVTDFGIPMLRSNPNKISPTHIKDYAYYKSKLWTAPELLNSLNQSAAGTQKGDVYSFGIILQEIELRNGPFYLKDQEMEPLEIIANVKSGSGLRPSIESGECNHEIAQLMKRCWSEDPADRPDFTDIRQVMRRINKDGESGNILDNLLKRMEQYANNLEGLVEERTSDYLVEKKKAEELLYRLLPKSVASQLMVGHTVTAESFENVTIYFSDICGFTSLSSESTPLQVVDLLNDLYSVFDGVSENFDVYKVETIGDAYMVVSGLPTRNGDLHAREIARLSLALLNAVLNFRIRHRPDRQLLLRIGIHSGPCVAGVVGMKMPRFCLFGDTVNTASRMESNGKALRIHVSSTTKAILDKFGTFELKLRGDVEMKGKGKMTTYWLLGEIDGLSAQHSSLNWDDDNMDEH